jgi:hypothetical protein
VHGPPNSMLSGFPGYVGYNSLDSPREAPDSPMYQPCNGYLPRRLRPMVIWRTGRSGTSRATATYHVDQGQRSYGAPDRPVPHRKGNQPIRRFSATSCALTVHYPVCTGQSGAPTDKRQELPTKWSSNDF